MGWRGLLGTIGTAAITGLVLSWSIAYSTYGTWEQDLAVAKARTRFATERADAGQVSQQGKAKIELVNGSEHDFGQLERGTTGEFKFRIRNIGDANLLLEPGKPSCSCTKADLSTKVVAPGEEATLDVGWDTTEKDHGTLALSVPLLTNDEANYKVVFYVRGMVTVQFTVRPLEFTLGDMTTEDARTGNVRILSFKEGPFDLLKYELTDKETAEFYDVTWEPLPAESLEAFAKSGYNVSLKLRPGLRQGDLRQKLWLTHSLDPAHPVEIPVRGKVVGKIRVVGTGWNEEQQTLDLGTLRKGTELTRTLMVMVSGKNADTTQLKLGKISPEFIRAELSEPTAMGNGQVMRYRLKITLPADAPAANLRGNATGAGLGIIPLETSLPELPNMPLYLRCVITGI